MLAQVWFSVGHGNGDPGAVAVHNNVRYKEYEMCKQVVERVKRICEGQQISIGIVPYDLPLATGRIPWVNKNIRNDAVLVEVHMNSTGNSTVSGAEIFYRDGDIHGQIRADKLLKAYVTTTGQKSRGSKADSTTRHKRLGIIRDVRCKSHLIELGFISNAAEVEVVQSKAAIGLVNMALSWYNLPFLLDYGEKQMKQEISEWAKPSMEKARKKGIIENQTTPQDEVKAWWLAHVLHKLGGLSSPHDVLTQERLAVALDRLGLFDK